MKRLFILTLPILLLWGCSTIEQPTFRPSYTTCNDGICSMNLNEQARIMQEFYYLIKEFESVWIECDMTWYRDTQQLTCKFRDNYPTE